MFSIDEPTHLVLKPLEKFTSNIKCEKSRSISVGKHFFLYWINSLYTYVLLVEIRKFR